MREVRMTVTLGWLVMMKMKVVMVMTVAEMMMMMMMMRIQVLKHQEVTRKGRITGDCAIIVMMMVGMVLAV